MTHPANFSNEVSISYHQTNKVAFLSCLNLETLDSHTTPRLLNQITKGLKVILTKNHKLVPKVPRRKRGIKVLFYVFGIENTLVFFQRRDLRKNRN